MTIKGIELNGLPLADIEFAFNARGLVISCNHTNKQTGESELIKLYFNGVENLVTAWGKITDSTDIKITSGELEDSSSKQKAAFTFSDPAINLSFDYNTVHHSW